MHIEIAALVLAPVLGLIAGALHARHWRLTHAPHSRERP